MSGSRPAVSVVCPYYNEREILESSVRKLIRNLETLPSTWELVLVNDGSTDGSEVIASRIAESDDRVRLAGYGRNQGRGYALRAGIGQAHAELVVTTEIDGSWGENIVHRIVEELKNHPEVDMVIASPHLPGGGYENVPLMRVMLSTVGNWIIRGGLTYSVTMNTGMTRGYRRSRFLSLPLDEDGKEMHLEIVNKALAFGHVIREIPAVLSWPEPGAASGLPRKSSSRVKRLIRTHLIFSLLAAPFRYLYVIAALLLVPSVVCIGWGIVNLFNPAPSIYLFLVGLLMILFAFLTFALGVLAQQGRAIQRELWRVRRELLPRADSGSR